MKFVVVNGRPPRQQTRWLATAVAVLTLLLAFLNAAPGEEQPATGVAPEFNKEDGTLYIDWSGPIVAGMADNLRAAVGKCGMTLNRLVLFLDSAGGQVEEGDRVIAVLNELKLRHQLITVVPHGKLCASMCNRSSSKARTVLRRGRASGSSTRPPSGRQTASSEPTWRRRGGCSANTTPLPVSQCIGSKASRP
jgi:hypothetical protein